MYIYVYSQVLLNKENCKLHSETILGTNYYVMIIVVIINVIIVIITVFITSQTS